MGDRGIPRTLAPHERLRLAHLHVGQRGRRAVLGEVPLQDRPGHRELHQRRGRARSRPPTPISTAATCSRRSSAASSRAGRCTVQIMPYDDATDYRFNPFDLTKVWPHADYPLIKVGTMTLNRNPENFFAQIEQAAFEPGNMVPGIGFARTRCCSAGCSPTPTPTATGSARTTSSCRSTGRRSQVQHLRCSTAPMRYEHPAATRSTPRTPRRPEVDADLLAGAIGWEVDGDMVRAAYTLHAEDDDFGQAERAGEQGDGPGPARPAGRDHRVDAAAPVGPTSRSASSSTGATSTRPSAMRWPSWSTARASSRTDRRRPATIPTPR